MPRTARNIARVYLGDVLSKGVAVLTTIIIIRSLSKEDYGLYTNFLAVMNFIAPLIGTGMNTCATRYASEYISLSGREPSYIFVSNLAIQLVAYLPFGLLLSFFPSKISNLFFNSDIYSEAVLLGGLASLGLIFIQVVATIYQSSENFSWYVIILNGRQAVLFVGIMLLWALNYVDFHTVANMTVFVQLLLGIALMVLMRQRFALKNLSSAFLREFFKSGSMLMLFYFFLSLISQLGVFIIARFHAAEELAVYGVALKYYGLALTLLGSIHAVLMPKFSRAENMDDVVQKDFVFRWLRVSSLSIIPIALVGYYAQPIFMLLNNQQYHESINIFRVFCVGIVTSFMFSPLVNILIGRKKYTYITVISFAALLMNFGGNILVIRPYGVLGIAVVNVFTYMFVNISMFAALLLLWTRK